MSLIDLDSSYHLKIESISTSYKWDDILILQHVFSGVKCYKEIEQYSMEIGSLAHLVHGTAIWPRVL